MAIIDTAGAGIARMRRGGLWLAGAVVALALVACSPVFRNHGYVPGDADLALVEVGTDTRDTVAEKVGRPTAAGLLNDLGWYYVQSRYRHFGPREPQEIERQVLAISFTESGTVSNIERFGLEDGKVVAISRRVTETNIKGIGLLSQLFANFGRIDTSSLVDNNQ